MPSYKNEIQRSLFKMSFLSCSKTNGQVKPFMTADLTEKISNYFLLLLLFLLTILSFTNRLPIKVVISQSTISIHSDIGRLRHFHHFGNVLNLAMRSVDNPKISL